MSVVLLSSRARSAARSKSDGRNHSERLPSKLQRFRRPGSSSALGKSSSKNCAAVSPPVASPGGVLFTCVGAPSDSPGLQAATLSGGSCQGSQVLEVLAKNLWSV